jgi:hypothetical protein
MNNFICPHCLSADLVLAAHSDLACTCPFCKAQVSSLGLVRRRSMRTGLNVVLGFLVGLLLGLATFALLLVTILLACRCARAWESKKPESIQRFYADEGVPETGSSLWDGARFDPEGQ